MKKGFTLIELLVVIALIAILATTVILGMNPARQFAQARNAQRWTHVNSYLKIVHQNRVDNNGMWVCGAGDLPSSATNMSSGVGDYDICDCLVPTYARALAPDPSAPDAHFDNCEDYDLGYTIMENAADNRITIAAPAAEVGVTIGVTQ